MEIYDEISVSSWLEIIVFVHVSVDCLVGMFVVTDDQIYIGLHVFIDAGLAAGDSVGNSIGTDMVTSVGVRMSVSIMNIF